MTDEEALAIVNNFLGQERLSDIQQRLFQQSWAGHSYSYIAHNTGYKPGYIKDVGFKLWRMLSKKLGERVNKKNVRLVLQAVSNHHNTWKLQQLNQFVPASRNNRKKLIKNE